MFGLTSRSDGWPRPYRVVGRFLITTVLVLSGVHEFGVRFVKPLLPAYTNTIALLDDRFMITDARVTDERASEILRFRANLARPLLVDGRELYPFGWNRLAKGGFQITYTVGGTLQFDALLLIAVLAWPAGSASEMAWRVGMGMPLGALLLLLDVPVTVVAELQNFLATAVDPNGMSDWMIASRFLMGGGGAVIALVAALLSVLTGRVLTQRRGAAPGVARWRRVSRAEFDAFFRDYPRALEVSPPFAQLAGRHTLQDHSLGTGRNCCVGDCRTRWNMRRYRIRADLAKR